VVVRLTLKPIIGGATMPDSAKQASANPAAVPG